MSTRLPSAARRAAGFLVAIAIGASVGVAPAHAEEAPYHSFPNNAFYTSCAHNLYNGWGLSLLEFNQPSDVRSRYASEWVYFRPIAARSSSTGWQYTYGSWQRGLARPTGLQYVAATYGASKWTSADGAHSESLATLKLPAGVTHWLGYQLHWSTMGYTYTNWLAQRAC